MIRRGEGSLAVETGHASELVSTELGPLAGKSSAPGSAEPSTPMAVHQPSTALRRVLIRGVRRRLPDAQTERSRANATDGLGHAPGVSEPAGSRPGSGRDRRTPRTLAVMRFKSMGYILSSGVLSRSAGMPAG